MVATRRRAESRSGAMRPIARQAPLNSSIPLTNFSTSGVMARAAILGVPSILTSNSIQLLSHAHLQLSIQFHPICVTQAPRLTAGRSHSSALLDRRAVRKVFRSLLTLREDRPTDLTWPGTRRRI